MSRWFTLIALLIAALICYWIGSVRGVVILLFVGVILEILFWLGLFGQKSSSA